MWPHLQIVNPHLLKDLTERGLWSDSMKNQLIAHNGSVQVELRQNKRICFISLRQRLIFYKQFLICQQNIQEIPDDLKQLYKTVWEISQKTVLKMAADRGAYIDQSQSLNIHIAEPNYGKLTSMHFYGWKLVRWGCAGGATAVSA